jgi:hypothetical protein
MPHPAVVLRNYFFFSTDAQPFSMDEANILILYQKIIHTA